MWQNNANIDPQSQNRTSTTTTKTPWKRIPRNYSIAELGASSRLVSVRTTSWRSPSPILTNLQSKECWRSGENQERVAVTLCWGCNWHTRKHGHIPVHCPSGGWVNCTSWAKQHIRILESCWRCGVQPLYLYPILLPGAWSLTIFFFGYEILVPDSHLQLNPCGSMTQVQHHRAIRHAIPAGGRHLPVSYNTPRNWLAINQRHDSCTKYSLVLNGETQHSNVNLVFCQK